MHIEYTHTLKKYGWMIRVELSPDLRLRNAAMDRIGWGDVYFKTTLLGLRRLRVVIVGSLSADYG